MSAGNQYCLRVVYKFPHAILAAFLHKLLCIKFQNGSEKFYSKLPLAFVPVANYPPRTPAKIGLHQKLPQNMRASIISFAALATPCPDKTFLKTAVLWFCLTVKTVYFTKPKSYFDSKRLKPTAYFRPTNLLFPHERTDMQATFLRRFQLIATKHFTSGQTIHLHRASPITIPIIIAAFICLS